MEEDMKQIIEMLQQMSADRTVPRNIRTATEEIIKSLGNGSEPMDVRISTAISTLDEISNDPNIPSYTRTQVWAIVSLLEKYRKQ